MYQDPKRAACVKLYTIATIQGREWGGDKSVGWRLKMVSAIRKKDDRKQNKVGEKKNSAMKISRI